MRVDNGSRIKLAQGSLPFQAETMIKLSHAGSMTNSASIRQTNSASTNPAADALPSLLEIDAPQVAV